MLHTEQILPLPKLSPQIESSRSLLALATLMGQVINTISQIILTKLELVTNWYRPFQIKPQTIVAWTRYGTNCFFGNDYGIGMFHRAFLNCKAMSIQWWWAPLNSPHTIPTHTLLNLQSLKSQNKCVIPNNPIGLASINIWTIETTWGCINSRLREIHIIMLMWIVL